MSEETKDQHQELKDNRQGIATAAGVVIFIAFGLIVRNDLLFGLVMATVYGSGMNAGVRMSTKLLEGDQGKCYSGPCHRRNRRRHYRRCDYWRRAGHRSRRAGGR